jgi:hypothetical protein
VNSTEAKEGKPFKEEVVRVSNVPEGKQDTNQATLTFFSPSHPQNTHFSRKLKSSVEVPQLYGILLPFFAFFSFREGQ